MHWLVDFFRKFISVFIGASIFMAIISVGSINAAITSVSSALPNVESAIYQVQDGDALYVNPTNSYNDNVSNYYLLTQDNSNKGLTHLVYDNQEYPITQVFVGTTTSAAKDAVQANSTLFVDDGTYNSDMHYCALSQTNFSLVGLHQTATGEPSTGEPSTIFVRTYTEDITKKTVDSYRFIHADVYIGNIILDGNHKNMYANKTYGQYGVVVAKGSVNFVMDHVIIQNIGETITEPLSPIQLLFGGTPCKNTAMQVLYESSGTRHFIDVTVRYVKTTSYGDGVVFQNQTKTYWKNLKIEASEASVSTYGMRVENADTSQLALTENSAIFAGNCNISTGYIQVQNYLYSTIAMPSNYRYVEYAKANGTSTGAYRVWTSIPPVSTTKAVLDRADNYWVVRDTSQINYIGTIRDFLSSKAVPSAKIPGMNVRIVSPNALASLTIPNCGGNTPITLVAVPSLSDLYTSVQRVPVAAAFDCSFSNSADAANALFANMDFAVNAEYTMHEAANILGTTTTPLFASAFANCKFIELAYGEQATPTLLNITADKTEIYLSETANVLATIPSFYTYENLLSYSENTGVDDQRIAYTSSNNSIATVDTNGTVHPVSVGSLTIHAVALDKYNQGEVVRPSADITISIVANPMPTETTGQTETTLPTETTPPTVPTSPTAPSAVLGVDKSITPTPTPATGVLGTSRADENLPKTGEASSPNIAFGVLSILLSGGLLVLIKKRKKHYR